MTALGRRGRSSQDRFAYEIAKISGGQNESKSDEATRRVDAICRKREGKEAANGRIRIRVSATGRLLARFADASRTSEQHQNGLKNILRTKNRSGTFISRLLSGSR